MALHRTRQAFITQESCERLRRALNRQTRSFSDVVYQMGDQVYFKRNESKEWYGPAKVLGCEKSQYLLKHGGNYVRVHPCRMQLVNISDSHGLPGNVLVDDNFMSKRIKTRSETCTNDMNVNVERFSESEDDNTQNSVVTSPETPHITGVNNDTTQQIPTLQTEQNENNELIQIGEEVDHNERVKIPRALARLKDHNSPGLKEMNATVCHRSRRTQNNETQNETVDQSNENRNESGNENEKVEVYFGTSTDSARYDKAKVEELEKWKEFDAYEEVPDTGQPRVTSKWVCTEKM